jgi:Fe-S cluster biogenesis protein NfuA
MEMSNQEIFQRVKASLDGIRSYLEADGGDITLVEITDDMTALVELHGACCNCSMSSMTMKAGVEGAIKAAVPEIIGVREINGN